MTGRLVAHALMPIAVLAASGLPSAAAAADVVRLQPHRAVYDLSLVTAASGSGMSEMTGRLVYEIRGAACEGYAQSMRLVTRATGNDGSDQMNDIRTSSFEEATGERLDFSSTHEVDSQTQVTEGRAARTQTAKSGGKPIAGKAPVDKDGAVRVELKQPEARQLSLPSTVYFPIQHSLALLDVARSGGRLFVADLYDGSEKGDKVSATTTVIGKPASETADALPENAKLLLKGARYWPISTSYFEKTQTLANRDAVPSHEMSARFYENGVSTRLVLDYGDFSLKGELKQIEFLPEPSCAGRK